MEKFIENFFPFHFILSSELKILRIGKSAQKLFPYIDIDFFFSDYFFVVRPKSSDTFQKMANLENMLFVVQTKKEPVVQIKGQVKFKEDENILLFVFTPIIREVSFYRDYGIKMDDLPFYDNSLEFLFALQAANKSLEEARLISRKFEERVNERTLELKQKNEELQVQHEEFLQQQEQLNKQSIFLEEKNRKLQRVRELIHSKNRELKRYSSNLENQVKERTKELTTINRELTEQNNQLEQFAFIVAHNLRAPIARILGLINLMRLQSLITPEGAFYIDGIKVATRRLEEVIKDLNIILEIRKGLSEAFQIISLSEKINKVKETLRAQIEESEVIIYTSFEMDELYSLSSYIENIFYNLLSNAIKYRHPERVAVVKVQASFSQGEACIVVTDNGIGFDMEANKDNVFKLYRRFHDHVEGKGLGLYMMKIQCEALGGRIEVESKPEEGATFRLYIPQPQYSSV